jgi:hypothetical protein
MSNCKNCDQSLDSLVGYCSNCGQSTQSFQQPIGQVCKSMLHELADIDGRMALTLKTLVRKPGLLSLEYNQGRRMRYTPPLRIYLVISILFFFILSQIFFDSKASSNELTDQIPRLMFILLPVYASFLSLLYRQTYYISNLVFAIHVHGFSYLLLILIMPLEFIAESTLVNLVIQSVLTTYLFVYLFLAMKRNFQQSWLITLAKFMSITLGYIFIILIFISLLQESLK